MRTSTDLDDLAVLEELAPRAFGNPSDTPTVVLRQERASNDAACEDPATTKNDVEAWAQHALAANGFGDVATLDTRFAERPTSVDLLQAARGRRSFTLGEIVIAATQAAVAYACRAYARHRQRRQARVTYEALVGLDDRTLRDLGFHRSEVRSVAAEVTGDAERTRVRALLTLDRLP